MSVNNRIRPLRAAAACLLTACLLSACSSKAPQQEEFYLPDIPQVTTPAQANYETAAVELGEFRNTVSGKVSVVYPIAESLYWEGSTARFVSSPVSAKQEVKKGDVLMTFQVETSTADLTALRLERDRLWQELQDGKASRLADIEAKKQEAQLLTSYDRRIAELTVEKMEAAYDAYVFKATQKVYDVDTKIIELEKNAANTTLVAPFDGVIDSVARLNPGDPISKSTPLITMHAAQPFVLNLTDSSQTVRYNMPVTIQSGSGNKLAVYTGRVVAAPNILPHSLSQKSILVQLDENVASGDLANTLRFSADTEIVQNILVAPRGAFDSEEGRSFVYVLENGIAQKKYVVSQSNNTGTVWILEGLSQGQTLIID